MKKIISHTLSICKKNIYTEINNFFLSNNFFKNLIFAYLIYLIAFLAILHANYINEIDLFLLDNVKNLSVSNIAAVNKLFSFILFAGTNIQDISPIPQLIAIFFLSISSVVLVHLFCSKVTFIKTLLATAIGLSPYFLVNMTQRFNCLSETFCILTALIPFCFFDKKSTFYLFSALSLIIICCLWLPAINIFLLIFYFKILQEFLNKNITDKYFLTKISVLLLLFLLYVSFGFNKNPWQLFCSLCKYYQSHWQANFLGITFSTLFISFVCYLIFSFKTLTKNILDQFILSFFSIGCALCCLFFIQGWLGITSNLSAMGVGFGSLLSVMLLMISNAKKSFVSKGAYILGLILVYQLVIFSNKFGNLVLAQEQYERMSFETLNEELDVKKIKHITVKPSRLYVPIVLMKAEEYPIWKDLIFFNLNNDTFLTYMNSFLNANLKHCTNENRNAKGEVLSQTAFWKINNINSQCVELDLKK